MAGGLGASGSLSFLPERQHQPRTTTLEPLLFQIYCALQRKVIRDQIPLHEQHKAASSAAQPRTAPLSFPCGAVPHSTYPPHTLQIEISPRLLPGTLSGTNDIQIRCNYPEAPGRSLTALRYLLGCSMPCALRDSAHSAPPAQGGNAGWAVRGTHPTPVWNQVPCRSQRNNPGGLEGEF